MPKLSAAQNLLAIVSTKIHYAMKVYEGLFGASITAKPPWTLLTDIGNYLPNCTNNLI